MADWNETQKHEAEYWGNCLGMRAWGEFVKQEMYAREMGLWEAYGNGTGELVMGQRSVLDVGGGPVSMTLRCLNARYPTVVDPCDWPASVERRYRNYGIHFVRAPGEELDQHRHPPQDRGPTRPDGIRPCPETHQPDLPGHGRDPREDRRHEEHEEREEVIVPRSLEKEANAHEVT
jgi:hypothetical protein